MGAQNGRAGFQRINSMDNEIYGRPSSGVNAVLNSRAMGDPGLPFLGGLLGGVGRVLLGGIKRVFSKPRPALGGAIIGSVATGAGGARVNPFHSQDPFGQQVPMVPAPGLGGAIQRFVPGGATGMVPAGPPPKGYRLNKTGYFVENVKGQPEQGGHWIAPGTKYVRYRYNNPANARKTRRAISQIERAKKYQKDLSRITVRKSCK